MALIETLELAVALGALAVSSCAVRLSIETRTSAERHFLAYRESVKPHLELCGDSMESECAVRAHLTPRWPDLPGPGPLLVRNLGEQPIVDLTWSVRSNWTDGEDLPSGSTHALTVPVRGVAALWHTRKQEAPLRLDSHGGAITLWFDSVLGDHYVCTYRLNGSLWSHGKVQQVSERPMPALGPQVVPSESPVRLHPDLMAVAS